MHYRRILDGFSLKSKQRVGRQSADSRPTVGRLSTDCRPTVDQRVGRRVGQRVGGIGFFTFTHFAQKPSDIGYLYQKDKSKLCRAVQICNLASTKRKRILVSWDLLLICLIILLKRLYLITLALTVSTISTFRHFTISCFKHALFGSSERGMPLQVTFHYHLINAP